MELKEILRKIIKNKSDKVRKPIKVLIAIIIAVLLDSLLGLNVTKDMVLSVIERLF